MLLCAALLAEAAIATENSLRLHSPNGEVVAVVEPGERLSYSVAFRGRPVVGKSALGIVVDRQDLGATSNFTGESTTSEINERYATRGVHAVAVNHCRATIVSAVGGQLRTPWQLEVRVYDDGVAYRYRVPGAATRRVDGERTEWCLPAETVIWHQSADNRSYEAQYRSDKVGQLGELHRLMVPAALDFPGDAGYGLITEANLVDYSDMALEVAGGSRFRAVFHDDPNGWDHAGEIVSPWRVTLLAVDLNTLVNSDLVRNLCPPPTPELVDATWIRPGRSTWHWLTSGAPKLDEQKAWIDGASELGYEYHLVDDGWRNWNGGGENAWAALAQVVEYAKRKGVEIWAWVDSKYVFTPADRAEYFRRAKEIGVVGLKIDFPKPADYTWVRWYEDTLRDTAAAELMVNFHGPVKPTGRERTWPNEMTREAIRGREQGKLPATHDTALPFVRYVQGHADYTPTLLIPDRLRGSSFAHELAMAVVFTSPLLCMGDHPQRYLDSDARDVLAALPATWDETVVLPGSEIGELAAFARRKGDQWFVAMLNGPAPRQQLVDLKFLGDGAYQLVELADTPDRNDAFARAERSVTRVDTLAAALRSDGGYVAWLIPVYGKGDALHD